MAWHLVAAALVGREATKERVARAVVKVEREGRWEVVASTGEWAAATEAEAEAVGTAEVVKAPRRRVT